MTNELCNKLIIKNQLGLHARAAAKFVKIVERFDAEVTVTMGDTSVSACSIVGLMMLTAELGKEIQVCAEGPESQQVLDAVAGLVSSGFHEGAIESVV